MSRRGLRQNQRVRVSSAVGQMTDVLVREFAEIRAGNALMYYPEANILVPRTADAQSRTPAFKGTVVRVTPMETMTAAGHGGGERIASARPTQQTSGSGLDG
jgi:anaerobic selenocysteine-containing dehydrogenase